jgi:hypothetical protein
VGPVCNDRNTALLIRNVETEWGAAAAQQKSEEKINEKPKDIELDLQPRQGPY